MSGSPCFRLTRNKAQNDNKSGKRKKPMRQTQQNIIRIHNTQKEGQRVTSHRQTSQRHTRTKRFIVEHFRILFLFKETISRDSWKDIQNTLCKNKRKILKQTQVRFTWQTKTRTLAFQHIYTVRCKEMHTIKSNSANNNRMRNVYML